MKGFLLLVLFFPLLVFSQSKRKKKLAAEKANAALETQLTRHIQYLSDHKPAGTNGEKPAMQYILAQYAAMGLEPAGTNGYQQEFEIKEGKQLDRATRLEVDGQTLSVMRDYFPLPFSAVKEVKGAPAMALGEAGQPWFTDLKELLEENGNHPQVRMEEAIRKLAANAYLKKATALFLYNTSALTDNIQYNKKDTSPATAIPVIYITPEGRKKYFSDKAATLEISLKVAFAYPTRRAGNLVAFINNQAANTIILGAPYDYPGDGAGRTETDTGYLISNNRDNDASGTAALLELAGMLKKKSPQHNNYLFILFSREGPGLPGSQYWLEQPTKQISSNYMINIDRVGRYDTAHKLIVEGYGTSPLWPELIGAVKSDLLIRRDSSVMTPGDHTTFYHKNIPVLFLFTGNRPDYHKATGYGDKINYPGEKDIVKWIYDTISLADSKGKLPFTKTRE